MLLQLLASEGEGANPNYGRHVVFIENPHEEAEDTPVNRETFGNDAQYVQKLQEDRQKRPKSAVIEGAAADEG